MQCFVSPRFFVETWRNTLRCWSCCMIWSWSPCTQPFHWHPIPFWIWWQACRWLRRQFWSWGFFPFPYPSNGEAACWFKMVIWPPYMKNLWYIYSCLAILASTCRTWSFWDLYIQFFKYSSSRKTKALPKTDMEPQNDEFQKGSPFQTRVPILGEPTMSFRECTSIRCLAPTKIIVCHYRGMGSCTFQCIYVFFLEKTCEECLKNSLFGGVTLGFWTLDILACFCVGYYARDGTLVVSLRKIARQYLTCSFLSRWVWVLGGGLLKLSITWSFFFCGYRNPLL